MRRVLFTLIILVLAACQPGSAPPEVLPSATALPVEIITPVSTQVVPTTQPSEAPPVVEEQVSPATTTPISQTGQETVTGLPDPALYAWEKVFSGFQLPVFLSEAGDASGRLFIVSQSGVIYVVRDGIVLSEPFLDLQEQVSRPRSAGYYGERGLLGLAFHPRFHDNGFFYVNYTDRDGNTVIARYTSPVGADQADPQSELRLLTVEQPYANHNGGMLAFGPDGYLYIGLGDGGSAGDPQGNGQSLETWLGKILRIDVDGGEPYAIPADNPFAVQGGRPEIWASGLRNPWRFSFDALTGDLYIGDVGQGAWEEVDFLAAGSPGGGNFGWDYREGAHAYEGQPPGNLDLTDPVAEYSHEFGCSITGGEVYRGVNLAEWQGVYLYGDYCNGNVWGLLRSPAGDWQNQLMFATGIPISSFGVDEAGEVYLLDHALGDIYKLRKK
jgi:glucose/arabinose dehydrogenase